MKCSASGEVGFGRCILLQSREAGAPTDTTETREGPLARGVLGVSNA